MTPRVVVVGAGIAGLATAHALLRKLGDRCEIVVLERRARAGGPIRSEDCDGFLVEHGPNGFLEGAAETMALVGELGLAERLLRSDDRARRRFVLRAGRLHTLPGSPPALVATGLLSTRAKLRLLGEPWSKAAPAGDESIHDFVARRLGAETAAILGDAFVSGVYAGDARRLSVRACLPTIFDLERRHGGLLRGVLARRREPRRSLGRLTSFQGGTEQLALRLQISLGSALRTGTPVARLVVDAAGGYRVESEAGPAYEAGAVVLACPVVEAAALLRPLAPSAAAEISGIRSASLATIALGYQAASIPHPLDGFGFLVPRGEGPRVLGVLWDSSIFPGRAPAGCVLLRAMLGGAHDPAAAELDDGQLLAIVRRDLQGILGVTAEPRMTKVVRHRPGLPQYELGHLERLARIDQDLARWPGLFVTGSGYRGVAINSCIEDAQRVAELVAARV